MVMTPQPCLWGKMCTSMCSFTHASVPRLCVQPCARCRGSSPSGTRRLEEVQAEEMGASSLAIRSAVISVTERQRGQLSGTIFFSQGKG